tara:strand:+ start:408 stop:668 length:261 start_codon:yes stop_codon:yes gene_type:complete
MNEITNKVYECIECNSQKIKYDVRVNQLMDFKQDLLSQTYRIRRDIFIDPRHQDKYDIKQINFDDELIGHCFDCDKEVGIKEFHNG